MKMEYQNITSFLGTTSDNLPRFTTKKWINVHDQSGMAEYRYNPSKQTRFKTSVQIYVILVMHILLLKELLLLKIHIIVRMRKN